MEKARYILNLLIAALLFMTVAINRDGKLIGVTTDELVATTNNQQEKESEPQFQSEEDGMVVLHSDAVVDDVYGFAGETPLRIYLQDDKITKIELEPNAETPSFLNRVIKRGFLDQWNGLTLPEAASLDIDVVSGASMSSGSIATNVKETAAYASNVEIIEPTGFTLSLKEIVALMVIALGVVLNVIRTSKKWLRWILFALNVGVMGVWCGSFLSLAQFTSWIANGVNITTTLLPLTLLVVAIILPLFGKKGTYCSYHCPLGAAQELISLTNKKKIRIPTKIAKPLNRLRNAILAVLLFAMWIGVGFSLMDYEVFTVFHLPSAAIVVKVLALLFLVLSIFIHRPYCRFVCPTGALLTLSQKTKK